MSPIFRKLENLTGPSFTQFSTSNLQISFQIIKMFTDRYIKICLDVQHDETLLF